MLCTGVWALTRGPRGDGPCGLIWTGQTERGRQLAGATQCRGVFPRPPPCFPLHRLWSFDLRKVVRLDLDRSQREGSGCRSPHSFPSLVGVGGILRCFGEMRPCGLLRGGPVPAWPRWRSVELLPVLTPQFSAVPADQMEPQPPTLTASSGRNGDASLPTAREGCGWLLLPPGD